MIKAITFDLDNTLIDFMKMKIASSDAAARAMIKSGLNMNLKEAKKELFEEYIKDIEGNHAFQDFLKKNNSYDERILASAINAHTITKLKFLKTYPGVKFTLNELKKRGLKIAIVTDAPRLKAFQRLDAINISNLFDIVIGKEDTNQLKPSIYPFKKALKLLNVEPFEAMHVGDWPEKDILGAKKLGMKTCFARYGYLGKGKVVMADFKINSIKEILEIIKKINNDVNKMNQEIN